MTTTESEALLRKLTGTLVPFYDSVTGKEFMAKPEDIFEAERDLNRILHEDGFAVVDDWFASVAKFKEKVENGDSAWTLGCLSQKMDDWVHFTHELEGEHFVIYPSQYPCGSWEDCERGGWSGACIEDGPPWDE